MVSLQSANVAVRLNPLYGTSARHTQACMFWIAVRGSWLSVQVLSEDRKSLGVPVAYLLLRMCSATCDEHQLPATPVIILDKATSLPLTDTNPFLALFQSIKQVLSESRQRSICGVHDRRTPYRGTYHAYRVHREPFGTAGRMRLAGKLPNPRAPSKIGWHPTRLTFRNMIDLLGKAKAEVQTAYHSARDSFRHCAPHRSV